LATTLPRDGELQCTTLTWQITSEAHVTCRLRILRCAARTEQKAQFFAKAKHFYNSMSGPAPKMAAAAASGAGGAGSGGSGQAAATAATAKPGPAAAAAGGAAGGASKGAAGWAAGGPTLLVAGAATAPASAAAAAAAPALDHKARMVSIRKMRDTIG